MKKKSNEVTLKDFLDIFLPKLWIMILVGVICAGALSVYSVFFKKDTYTFDTLVFVQKNTSSVQGTADIEVAEKMVETFRIAIYEADKYLDEIAKQINVNWNSSNVRSMMSVIPYEDAPYLKIKVTHTDKKIAYDVATAIADLSPELPDKLSAEGLKVTIVDSPAPHETATPNSKNTARNAIVAFVAGFVLALACVWIVSLFDVKVKNAKKLEDSFDIPILAIIPTHEIKDSEEVQE